MSEGKSHLLLDLDGTLVRRQLLERRLVRAKHPKAVSHPKVRVRRTRNKKYMVIGLIY